MTEPRGGASGRGALDIGALLRVALDQAPHDDVQDRVMDRVAVSTTVVELARLVFVAPWHWLAAAEPRPEGGDDDGAGE